MSGEGGERDEGEEKAGVEGGGGRGEEQVDSELSGSHPPNSQSPQAPKSPPHLWITPCHPKLALLDGSVPCHSDHPSCPPLSPHQLHLPLDHCLNTPISPRAVVGAAALPACSQAPCGLCFPQMLGSSLCWALQLKRGQGSE